MLADGVEPVNAFLHSDYKKIHPMAPRGRPRSFDRKLALQRAMDLFWSKGYEGTQLTDLTAAMGINPPSFYAAFGSKAAAFREAIDLYAATAGGDWARALQDGKNAHESIRAMLAASVEVALAAPGLPGCMMILGLVNCTRESEPLRDLLRDWRRQAPHDIRARLEKGVQEQDLPPDADVAGLAAFYSAVLQAISLYARDGATREELDSIVACAMAAMPPAVQPTRQTQSSR
jgi:AcrR family transcriptional regulator